jgi:hypothetical protein
VIEAVAQLTDRLNYLATYATGEGCLYANADGADTRCHLYPDFAPHSFAFSMECKKPNEDWRPWFSGALLLYDVGATGADGPQFSVRLASDKAGWEIHT